MCILAVAQTIKVGLTKVGNEGKPLNHSEKFYLLQIYSKCLNVWPLTSITKLTQQTGVFTQKCQVSV
jgi:hypothetical protein